MIAVSVIPECGLGMCPDDPSPTGNLGDVGGWGFVLILGVVAVIIAFLIARVVDRRMASTASQ